MARARKTLQIGEVAARYGLHAQTLRLWERKGLLVPARSRGNARWYSADDLERLDFILVLSRKLGVNLAGIEVILHMRGRMEELLRDVATLRSMIDEQLHGAAAASRGALVPLRPRPLIRSVRRRAS